MTKSGKSGQNDGADNGADHEADRDHEPEHGPDEQDDLMAELEKAPPPPQEDPVMPTAAEQRRGLTLPAAPTMVRATFFVFIAAGLLGIASAILLMANKDDIVRDLIEQDENNLTAQQIQEGTTTLLWLLMIMAVTFAVLFVLFAYKAQHGVRRSRMLLTIVSVITVAFYYVMFPTPLGLLSALLALVGTVLLYLPSASRYLSVRQER